MVPRPRYQALGALVLSNPIEAHAKLAKLFAKHGSLRAVAKALPANARTLTRWVASLVEAGVGDPRLAANESAKKSAQKVRVLGPRKKVLAE